LQSCPHFGRPNVVNPATVGRHLLLAAPVHEAKGPTLNGLKETLFSPLAEQGLTPSWVRRIADSDWLFVHFYLVSRRLLQSVLLLYYYTSYRV